MIDFIKFLLIKYWNKIRPFWSSLGQWIIKTAKSITGKVHGAISHIKKTSKNIYENIAIIYSQLSNGDWQETTVTKKVSDSDIPEHIRKKLGKHEVIDTTKELGQETMVTKKVPAYAVPADIRKIQELELELGLG